MRKKRLSILALVLAAMFVFSACGGTSPSGTSTPTDSSKPDTGDPSVTKKDVVLWNRIFEEWNQEYFQRMGEEFNADPNNKTVNLIQEFVPGDAWDEKMKSAQAAGTAPDTYVQNYGNVIWGAAQGLLQPLDDYVPQDAWDDLMDNVKEFVSYKGKYYAYPQLVEPAIVLFYRADLFEQAGLDPNKPPKTWDELIEYAQKLAKYDANGNLVRAGISLRKSGGGSGVCEKWWFWLYPAGGSIITEVSPGKYRNNYNNEAGRRALQLYIDLLYKYKVDSHKVKADSEGFALGAHAMFTRESWVVGFMKESAPNIRFNAAPLPRDKRAGTICTLVNLYVAKNSKNKDEAWKFIQFMMKPEYQQFLLAKIGWFPCVNADYEPILQEIPQYRAFMELPEGYTLYSYPSLACYDEIQTKLAERLVKAFMDESLVDNPAGIAKVLAEAAAETDAILAENGVLAK